MITKLVSTISGPYPLPDWAKQGFPDLKGHQKHDLTSGNEGGNIVGAYDHAREEVVSEQTDTGLDHVVEGRLRWGDMPAHLLTAHENVKTGGIVRYYDNNNLYHDPQISGELIFPGDVMTELDATAGLLGDNESLQAVLPGPYPLSDLATGEHYGDETELLDAVSEFLAGEVDAFPNHKTLFLLEPSLVLSPPDKDVDERVPEAISAVSDATDADMIVHTYRGTLDGKVYMYLMGADVDAIGFDLVADDHDQTLYNINEYGTKDDIALGLADDRNTLVEDPRTICERVEWTLDNVQSQTFDTAYVTPSTELFYLPENRTTEKLIALIVATRDELKVEA